MNNDDRKARVLELGSDSKRKLEMAAMEYSKFKDDCKNLNPKIEKIYRDAGLTPPAPSPILIMQYSQAGHSARASELADVLEVIGSIVSFVGLTRSMGPAVAKFLRDTKKIPADFAEKQLVSRSIQLYEDALGASRGVAAPPKTIDIDITGADVAGHVVAGIMAAVVVGVTDGVIYLLEEADLEAQLNSTIKKLHPLRTAVYLSYARTVAARSCMEATDAELDALDALPKSTKVTALAKKTNAIEVAVKQVIQKAASLDSVIAELQQLDHARKSQIGADPAYVT